MSDNPKVTVFCDGKELSSWNFEFITTRKDIHVTLKCNCDPGFVVKEIIGLTIINMRGVTQKPTGEDMSDRRRDDNLREVFGG